jgi:meiosis-specific protein HOP1
MAYVGAFFRQTCSLTNFTRVGLKVTSLKWTGPDPEGSEIVPKVPMDLEYTDVVRRSEDIGLAEERVVEDDLKIRCKMCRSKDDDFRRDLPLSAARSTDMSQEATQDITEREKLQMMIPVRSPIETMNP